MRSTVTEFQPISAKPLPGKSRTAAGVYMVLFGWLVGVTQIGESTLSLFVFQPLFDQAFGDACQAAELAD